MEDYHVMLSPKLSQQLDIPMSPQNVLRIKFDLGENSPGVAISKLSSDDDPEVEETEINRNESSSSDSSLNDRVGEDSDFFNIRPQQQPVTQFASSMTSSFGSQKEAVVRGIRVSPQVKDFYSHETVQEREPVQEETKLLENIDELIELLMKSSGQLNVQKAPYRIDTAKLLEARIQLRSSSRARLSHMTSQSMSHPPPTQSYSNSPRPNVDNQSQPGEDEQIYQEAAVNFESSPRLSPPTVEATLESPLETSAFQLGAQSNEQNDAQASQQPEIRISVNKKKKKKKAILNISIPDHNQITAFPAQQALQVQSTKAGKKKKKRLSIIIESPNSNSLNEDGAPNPIKQSQSEAEAQKRISNEDFLNSLQDELLSKKKSQPQSNKVSQRLSMNKEISTEQVDGDEEPDFLKGLMDVRVRNMSEANVGPGRMKMVTKQELAQERDKYKQYYKDAMVKRKKDSLDIGYLFASPLIYEAKEVKGTLREVSAIRFQDEIEVIKQAVRESHQAITFKSKVATHSNFVEIINKQPRILHISCHGLHDDQRMNASPNLHPTEDDYNYLLFENDLAVGVRISANELLKLVRQTVTSLDLVFVAACDSEIVGKIFQRCGAQHVICVKQQRFVLDKAAIAFTKIFYSNVLSEMQICEAFKKAKAAVEFQFQRNEADLFTILLAADQSQGGSRGKKQQHNCYYLARNENGHLTCLSDHIHVKHVTRRNEQLKYHTKTLWRLVNSIQKGNRLNQLLGLHGLGKTSLAKTAMQYLMERKYFTGGLLYFPCKSYKNCFTLLQNMQLRIQEDFKLKADSLPESRRSYENDLEEWMFAFFQQSAKNLKLQNTDKHFSTQVHKFIVCFDNVEELIEHDGKRVRDLLTRLINQCELLNIVLISNRPIGILEKLENVIPEHIFLQQLKPTQSVELFIDQSDEIFEDEILNLILANPKGCIQQLLPDVEDLEQPISEQMRERILKGLRSSYKKRLDVLASHDMFKQISGNPLSISILCGFHRSKLKNNDLASIYKRLILHKDESNDGEKIQDETLQKFVDNRVSLKLSTEATLTLLEETSEKSYNLFYLLGCFPLGVTKQFLRKIWKNDLEKDLQIIDELSLLETNEKKTVTLWPFLVQYVGDSMDRGDQDRFMMVLCDHFGQLVHKVYMIYSEITNSNTFGSSVNPNYQQNSQSQCYSFLTDLGSQLTNQNELPKMSAMVRQIKQQHSSMEDIKIDELPSQASKQFNLDERKNLLAASLNEMRNIQHLLEFLNKKASGSQTGQNQVSAIRTNTEQFNNLMSKIRSPQDSQSIRIGILNSEEQEDSNNQESDQDFFHYDSLRSGPELNNHNTVGSFDYNRSISCIKDELLKVEEDQYYIQQKDLKQQSSKVLRKNASVEEQKNTPSDAATPKRSLTVSSVAHKRRQQFIKQSLRTLELGVVCEDHENEQDIESSKGTQTYEQSSSETDSLHSDTSLKEDENYKIVQQTMKAQESNSQSSKPISMQTLRKQEKPRDTEISLLTSSEEGKENLDFKQIYPMKHRFMKKASSKTLNETDIEKLVRQSQSQLWLGELYSDSEKSSSCDSASDLEQEPLSLAKLNSVPETDITSPLIPKQPRGTSTSLSNPINLDNLEQAEEEQKNGHDAPRKSEDWNTEDEAVVSSTAIKQQNIRVASESPKKKQKAKGHERRKKMQKRVWTLQELPKSFQEDLQETKKKYNNKRQAILNLNADTRKIFLRKKLTQLGRLELFENESFAPINAQKRPSSAGHKYLVTSSSSSMTTEPKKTRSLEVNSGNDQMFALNDAGRFILFIAAISFLSYDYEKGLEICKTNYSSLSNSLIFEGNILRLKAMCLSNLYKVKVQQNQHATQANILQCPNLQLVYEAINAVKNALEIYSHDLIPQVHTQNSNVYGLALSHFQLGFLYESFADDLAATYQKSQAVDEVAALLSKDANKQTLEQKLGSKQAWLKIAVQHFNKSLEYFNQINHLIGKQLAAKHMLVCIADDHNRRAMRVKLQRQTAQFEGSYNQYVSIYGVESSCHRERRQGPEVSLMIEMVMFSHNINMFPSEQESQLNLKKLFMMSAEKVEQSKLNSLSYEQQLLLKKRTNSPTLNQLQDPLQ